MSGIFGAWNLDGRPMERNILEGMGRCLAHRGTDGDAVFISGAAGLGCRLFRVTPEASSEVQPLVRTSGVAVVFDGRLDNRSDLIAALRKDHDVGERTPDPELVAALYETAGADFALRIEGDFALAVLDPRARRLLLARDGLGVRPLYYSHRRTTGTMVFATEIKAILAHPEITARVNEPVLAEYMVCRLHRQPEDGTTFFEGINTVPPAHIVVVTPEALTVRRYWDFDTRAQSSIRSFEQLGEGFAHYFQQSVRRRLRSANPVAVSVSGGLDSSSIYCGALAMHRSDPASVPPIVGITYTPEDGSPADESEFVHAIERFAGATIIRVPLATGMLDQAEESAWHAETPSPDSQWNTTRRVLEAASGAGSRVLLTGHWGDQVLFDQSYLVDLARSGALRTIGAHLRTYVEWHPGARAAEFRRFFLSDLTRHGLPPSIYRAVKMLRRGLARTPASGGWYDEAFVALAPRREFLPDEPRAATAHARGIYREIRSRYNVHCLEWHNKVSSMFGLETAFPFLDRDLIQFMLNAPGDVLNRNGVPKAILRQALQGAVPECILRRKSKADFTATSSDGIRRDSALLGQTLGPESQSVARGFVNARTAASSVADARAQLDGRSATSAGNIADLLGLELWLNAFFKGEKA